MLALEANILEYIKKYASGDVDAEKVPGSKRLLKFTIDIGLEKRTILAGIGADDGGFLAK